MNAPNMSTLAYLIRIPVRLFILSSKLAKNGQFLAFLCNKRPNLYPCMQLFDGVRVFDRLEYLSVFINHLIHDKKNQRRIVSYVPIFGW